MPPLEGDEVANDALVLAVQRLNVIVHGRLALLQERNLVLQLVERRLVERRAGTPGRVRGT